MPLGPRRSGADPVPRTPKKPRVSTFIVGGLAALFMIMGAFSGGIGGALVFLAITAALTGLYVLATGRRSWAGLPAKRSAGTIALAVSFALFYRRCCCVAASHYEGPSGRIIGGHSIASHRPSERNSHSDTDAVGRPICAGDERSAGC
ncbi:hypothetical protein ACFVTE_15000 [Arthrobacter sp. NPDC058097]|uniref:hypothetical protein n=1 Tax=Arthrobacter sp. NPDC058097 TaxID=3346340 RepID=UPI0036DBA612